MKKSCLDCHFICSHQYLNQKNETIKKEYRHIDKLAEYTRQYIVSCHYGIWESLNREASLDTVFRKDRGKKCSLFFPYDELTSIEAAIEKSKRQEEVIDRKQTRRLAWIAIAISAFATLLSAIIPNMLFNR